MQRLAVTVLSAALIACASASPAVAQTDGGGAFGPLPPAPEAPVATPTPPPSVEAQQETDRTVLIAIAGVLIVLFVVIGRFITRDARDTLRSTSSPARGAPKLREDGPHRHARQTKAKARAKGKAQRAARRQNR